MGLLQVELPPLILIILDHGLNSFLTRHLVLRKKCSNANPTKLNLTQQDKSLTLRSIDAAFQRNKEVAVTWALGPLAHRDSGVSEEQGGLEKFQFRRLTGRSGKSWCDYSEASCYPIPQQTQGGSGHLQGRTGTSATCFCTGFYWPWE